MQAWDAFLCDLEQKMGKETVDRWLRTLHVEKFDACNLFLNAQHSFQIAWFEEHVRTIAESTFVNNNSHPIQIHLIPHQKVKKKKRHHEELPINLQITSDAIDPQMSFSNFIFDEQNALSVDFFKQLTPGIYNPLFLYGPAGVGKTHLLMAVAKNLQQENLSVFYVHAETFTEHVVKAIRTPQMRTFRSIYRNQDVLSIDDVHHFARKTATQEELFHTFNTLHQSGKQIILASHLPPNRIEEIEPRLTSRFEWGIVLQLHSLSQKKMREVLYKRADVYQFPLSDVIITFLTESFESPKSMMRAFEALMMRHQSSTPITLEEVKRLLQDLLDVEKKSLLTPEKILQSVSAHFGINVEDILSKSQSKECSTPRKMAMYFCRKKLNLPYLTIGRLFKRDHSTVMSSIKQIQQKSTSEEIESALEELEVLLNP